MPNSLALSVTLTRAFTTRRKRGMPRRTSLFRRLQSKCPFDLFFKRRLIQNANCQFIYTCAELCATPARPSVALAKYDEALMDAPSWKQLTEVATR
jgi:hypothetical protein